MNLVLLESPFAGDVDANLAYARAAMRDCFARGEVPFASHALYTQPGVLDDGDPRARALGIAAGLAWGAHARATVVYGDRGVSSGMRAGIATALRAGRAILVRSLLADGEAIARAARVVESLARPGHARALRGVDQWCFPPGMA